MFHMSVKVTRSKDRAKDISKAMDELESNQVLVGIPAEKAPRTSAEAKAQGAKINNAALGYIHNFGLPSKNIPQRQFLEPGIHNAEDGISVRMSKAAQGALDGDTGAVQQNMTAVGILASSSVKAKINAGPFAPLDPKTLAARASWTNWNATSDRHRPTSQCHLLRDSQKVRTR